MSWWCRIVLRSRLDEGWSADERHVKVREVWRRYAEMRRVDGLMVGMEFTRRITGSSIQGERIDKVNKRNEKAHIIISQEKHASPMRV